MEEPIKLIREYTTEHAELRAAHHFLFDIKISDCVDFVVMGINPGETDDDWIRAPGPTEETSLFDFHQGRRDKSSADWFRNIIFFLQTDHVLLAEYFFWSSKNTHEKFVERFGPLAKSPHLEFCRDMNIRLIDHYRPKAIISPGLGMATLVAKLYGLHRLSEQKADNGHNLVFHYSDGKRPWIFTKHWTGARGFSNTQRAQVREFIARHAPRNVPG